MKKYLIGLVLLLVCEGVFAQQPLTKSRIDSIWSYNPDLGNTLRIVKQYNKICTSLGIVDTLRISEKGNQFLYFLGENEVKNFKSGYCMDDRFELTYSKNSHFPYLHVKVKPTINRQFELSVSKDYKCHNYLVLKNFSNGVLDGRYIERCLNGSVFVEGMYTQVDSVYQDTLSHIDYHTYEETIEIVQRTKSPIKCGTWKFGEYGNQIKHYLKCPD
ncbi:MAG: hypothetical protein P1U56_03070 [Saprospiraceae bacterium]|nr:hypothetical protein [Saprospiraceae bacterium]